MLYDKYCLNEAHASQTEFVSLITLVSLNNYWWNMRASMWYNIYIYIYSVHLK